jgi:hypothetical protein
MNEETIYHARIQFNPGTARPVRRFVAIIEPIHDSSVAARRYASQTRQSQRDAVVAERTGPR